MTSNISMYLTDNYALCAKKLCKVLSLLEASFDLISGLFYKSDINKNKDFQHVEKLNENMMKEGSNSIN